MLFNSYGFIFLFLPAVLAAFYTLGAFDRPRAAVLLVAAASILFYSFGQSASVALLLGSVLLNYGFGIAILRAERARRALLWAAVGADLAVLAYFKYAIFAET